MGRSKHGPYRTEARPESLGRAFTAFTGTARCAPFALRGRVESGRHGGAALVHDLSIRAVPRLTGDRVSAEAREEAGIAGAVLLRLVPHPDPRGSFSEVYRQEWLPENRPMVQSNWSRSRAGVLRGMHFHRAQADYWCFLEGQAQVGLYDLRPDSRTYRTGLSIELSAEAPTGLFIPPGVAHGFCARTDVGLQYLVDAYYTGADEFGVAWNDPDLGFHWAVGDPVLSERDRTNPPLAQVLAEDPLTHRDPGTAPA